MIFSHPALMLPNVVISAAIVIVLIIAYRRESAARSLFLGPLACGLAAGCGAGIWMFHGITTSKSSTAAIGFFFLPFFALAAGNAAFLTSWAVLYVVRFAKERLGYLSSRTATWWLLIPAVLILVLAAYVAQHDVRRYRLLKAAAFEAVVPVSREDMLADAIAADDLDVLSRLAKNSSVPGDELLRIYEWSQTTFGKFKPFEYPIFSALARNRNTPSHLFGVLVKCPQSTIRLMAAQNPATPQDLLRRLADDPDQLVRGQARYQLNRRERGEAAENP